jgi:hypothetical protein
MRPRLVLAVVVAVLACPAPSSAAVHLTQIDTFDTPVYVTAPPDDPERLFVVEKTGRIMEVHSGQKLGTPFLDLTGSVVANGEQGLLSMAFAPDYATSRKFYVYYTAAGVGGGSVITIEEWQAAGDGDAVDPGSRRVLVQIPHPDFTNHNGGQLQFGPDGGLYAAPGDGGGTPQNAQDPGSMLGKVLRIDPAAATVQIWASGLRNPWRFSFDRQTHDMLIADVGQSDREEVDVAPAGTGAGVNYGWTCWEGTLHHDTSCDPPDDVFPVLEKDHGGDGFCAIVGGYAVRDPALSGLTGRYLYGDNCQNGIRSAVLVPPPGTVSDDAPTGLSVDGLTSFGEDSCGHVYAASGAGPVYRIDGDAFTPCPAASGPPGGNNGGNPPVVDARAPFLRLTVRGHQRVLHTRRVRLTLRCSETCGVSVGGKIRISRSRRRTRFTAKPATRQLAGKRRTTVGLALTRRGRRAIARGLRHHRSVKIKLAATARDSAGNRRTARKTVSAIR